MAAYVYPIAVVVVLELCLLVFRSGRLTIGGAMKRAVLAAFIPGIIYGVLLRPEGTDPGLIFYFLGIALLVFVLALIPATLLALVWALWFGGSRDEEP